MLTIVIPFYKLKYFDETLSSLSNQTKKDFKVIVGNDGSPEDPIFLLKEYRDKLNIKYIHFAENLGSKSLVKHWRRCIDLVGTEWFMILGDDDTLGSNAVEEFYKVAETTNFSSSVFKFNRQVIGDEGEIVGNPANRPKDETATEFLYQRSLNAVGSSLGEYIFRTDAYKKYGIRDYPKAFYSDNMMVLEYSSYGNIQPIEALAFIRISEESLSGNLANRSALQQAGWFFYYDIINEASAHFESKHLFQFFNILLSGVKNGLLPITKFEYILQVYKHLGLKAAARKVISLLKP